MMQSSVDQTLANEMAGATGTAENYRAVQLHGTQRAVLLR